MNRLSLKTLKFLNRMTPTGFLISHLNGKHRKVNHGVFYLLTDLFHIRHEGVFDNKGPSGGEIVGARGHWLLCLHICDVPCYKRVPVYRVP